MADSLANMSSRSSSIIPSAVSGSFGRRSRNRAAEGPSLTYAFACAVLPHKVHRFSKSDFRDTRILVGEGATSTVYKVLIQTPGREEAAAIKQKRLKGSWFDHDVSVESWLQTAYSDIRIMSHDSFRRTHNVVTALGYFWEPFEYTDGSPGLSPCLVLPLAMDEAPTLQHFFASLPKEGRAVGGALQFSLARDIANGLHELHSCGVVHGDLKPANILLFRETVDGPITAKLSDFSHSFIMSDYEGGKTKNLPRYTGTPPFVTPEVRRWEREMMATGNPSHLGDSVLDMPNYYACDMFSLGDILRALATDGENLWRWLEVARHPDDVVHEFEEDDVLDHPSLYVGEIVAEVARFSFLTPHRAAAICECLEMCLQEDPEARGTALDVRNRLDEAEVEVGPSTLPRSQLAAMIQYIESSVDASPAARNLALSFLANLTADSDPSTVKEKPYQATETSFTPLRTVYGSITEFAHIVALDVEPRTARPLLQQIYREFEHKAKMGSQGAAILQASCLALGLGTAHDMDMALGLLVGLQSRNWVLRATVPWLLRALSYSDDERVDWSYADMQQALRWRMLGALSCAGARNQGHTQRVRLLKVLSGARSPDGPGVSLAINRGVPDPFMPCNSLGIDSPLFPVAETELEYSKLLRSVSARRSFSQHVPTQPESRDTSHPPEDEVEALIEEFRELLTAQSLEADADIEQTLEETTETLHRVREAMLAAPSSREKLKTVVTFIGSEPSGPERLPCATLLHLAVEFVGGDSSFKGQARVLQCVKAALRAEGMGNINIPGALGETALISACRCGQFIAAKYLLSLGADASIADDSGITALHWLGFFEDEDIATMAERLVKNGANLNARTTELLDLPEHAINLQAGCTPLHYAVAMRSTHAVSALLRLGADPFQEVPLTFAYEAYFFTPLHFAISLHFHEIVRQLLEVDGASDKVRFRGRRTPHAALSISIVNLTGICLVMPSMMAPFGRILAHGAAHEDALDKTLGVILDKFPAKDVLELVHARLTSVWFPAEDPIIFRAWKRRGLGPRKVTLPELQALGLPSYDTMLHQGQRWEVELWLRAASECPSFQTSGIAPTHAALIGVGEGILPISEGDMMQTLMRCISRDQDGLLSVILPRLDLSPLDRSIPFLVFLAAECDSIGCLEVMWQVLIENAENDHLKTRCIEYEEQSKTALHRAAEKNATRAMGFLLDHGWDMDRDLGTTAGTPLNVAATSLLTRDAAILLLRRGANLFCCRRSGAGFNVLHRALQDPDVELKGDQQFSLVRILVESCADLFLPVLDKLLGARDHLLWTPLHLAVFKCDMPSVLTLLELGRCDLAAEDSRRFTPLMLALYSEHFAEARFENLEAIYARRGWGLSSLAELKLGHQPWMVERWREMAGLLVKAGSPVPKTLGTTGDYEFLFVKVAQQLSMAAADPERDLEDEFRKAFKNFRFLQHPSPRTGLDPVVKLFAEQNSAVIFPDGCVEGEDVPWIQMEYGRPRSASSGDPGQGIAFRLWRQDHSEG